MADRLALIIEGMLKAVACCGGARPIGISGLPVKGVAGPLLTLIWNRLRGIITRFARAATTPAASSRHRAQQIAPEPLARSRPVKPLLLPRHYAWLLLLVQETAGGASQLRHFLNDPEIAALIAADPRLGRILRPLCHMLGIRRHHVPCLYPQPLRPSPAQPSPPPAPDAPSTTHDAAPPPEVEQCEGRPAWGSARVAGAIAAAVAPPPPDAFFQTSA